MVAITKEAQVFGDQEVQVHTWETPNPPEQLYIFESTSSNATVIQVDGPTDFAAPYDEEVFRKLSALPGKTPNVPDDGDDDL